MSRKKSKPLIEQVTIEKIAAEGKALGRVEEKVIFVPNCVPGDIVDVQVTKKRKKYYEGFVTKYHKLSDMRLEPFCPHFGVCGGCKWQNVPYNYQLQVKQDEVINNLTRLGHVELGEVFPILGSEKTEFYRNKLEFTFSSKRYLTNDEIGSDIDLSNTPSLGFHVPRLFDKVVDIKMCGLQRDPSNTIRNFIREYALANELPFFNIKGKEGFLRTLIIRTSTTGEIMVIVTLYHEDVEAREGLLNAIAERFPEITSLLYVINEKPNDTIADQEVVCYKGNDHIFEQMEGLRFKIGPKSFYQTNSEQAYILYSKTREFAGLTGDEIVYDLYTGTGTIANFVARSAKKVVGIEYVPDAIADAKVNSEINGIDNTIFYAGDMKDVLNDEFIAQHGAPDVIITDPPRAGMHEDVVDTILRAAPKRIVYVSCNSATQARDLQLMDAQYKVIAVQPVDMFPHTHHVENIVLLEKR
ncbi:MAG: 23S rRNA (uracil(1939)-C(5))-methyltransferase RlmD [Marinifilaceae bacterium]